MNWEAMTAAVAMISVVGAFLGALFAWGAKIKAHDTQLADHAKAHEEHFRRESVTSETMARTVTLIDQVEKRVTRIEVQDDMAAA